MIPSFSVSGVLPPFVGNDPTQQAAQAPYRTSMEEVVNQFSFNLERVAILEGLFDYREQMRSLKVQGYQWLDGSFVEDCERTRNRPPADIDIITFAYRPKADDGRFLNPQEFDVFSDSYPELFDPEEAKEAFKCDAYYVDLNQPPHFLTRTVTYWCNLFSHSRVNNLWKGILEVELNVDDTEAKAILEQKKQSLLAAVGGDNA